MNDSLLNLLEDQAFQKFASIHLGESAISLYESYRKQIASEHFVVPVFGVQGSGKSTFLNALLFSSPVLPVDADETTCVPVVIKWSAKPSAHAEIVYADGRRESVAATEDGLRPFVDNVLNQGNQKGVDRVILNSSSELLETGMVLVDLPGVGSLTRENLQTTMRFLEEAVGVIFMLRTNPPLTRSDSILLQGLWPRLPYAIFVQNQWNDEPSAEALEGKYHNAKVLRDIAQKARLNLNTEGPVIHLVNAYKAWAGKLRNDASAVGESGIHSLQGSMIEQVCDWPRQLHAQVLQRVKADMSFIQQKLFATLDDLRKSSEQLEAEAQQEKERFAIYTNDLDTEINTAKSEIETSKNNIQTKVYDWEIRAGKQLRNEMRTKMRSGIVDGSRLSKALEDEKERVFEDVLDIVSFELRKITARLDAQFKNIPSWNRDPSLSASPISVKERKKWENILPPVGGSGGAALGLFGAVALGSQIGLPAGPVGVAAGALLGFVCGFIGGWLGTWLGEKGRDMKREGREKTSWPIVEAAIAKYTSSVAADFRSNSLTHFETLNSALDSWMAAQKDRFFEEQQKRQTVHFANATEREAQKAEVEGDLTQLSKFNVRISS